MLASLDVPADGMVRTVNFQSCPTPLLKLPAMLKHLSPSSISPLLRLLLFPLSSHTCNTPNLSTTRSLKNTFDCSTIVHSHTAFPKPNLEANLQLNPSQNTHALSSTQLATTFRTTAPTTLHTIAVLALGPTSLPERVLLWKDGQGERTSRNDR